MKYYVLRFAFSLAGIFLLYLIGILGECLINIANMVIRDSGADLPVISEFYYHNFLVNRDHFILSLTPFMTLLLLIIGLPPEKSQQKIYWCIFKGIWALVFAFCLVFVIALVFPFIIMGVNPDSSLIPTVVLHAHILIVALSIIVFAWSYQRWKRSSASSSTT